MTKLEELEEALDAAADRTDAARNAYLRARVAEVTAATAYFAEERKVKPVGEDA